MKIGWWILIGALVLIAILYFIFKDKNCMNTKEGIKCFKKPIVPKNGDRCILPNEYVINGGQGSGVIYCKKCLDDKQHQMMLFAGYNPNCE